MAISTEQAMGIPAIKEALERSQQGRPPLIEPGQVFKFVVYGKPIEQGSMTSFQDPHTGRLVMKHTEGLPQWRKTVAYAARLSMRGRAPVGKHKPLLMGCEFRFARPAAGKPGSAMALDFPTLGHDFDKLKRAIGDALTGVVYHDDGQIIGALLPDGKRWCRDNEQPGVVIRIALVSEQQRAFIQS